MESPVRLLFANSIETGRGVPAGSNVTIYWAVEAYIEVENLAYQKQVGARFGSQDTEATYVGPSWRNREIWRVVSPSGTSWRGSSDSIRFAIYYRIGGETYWDNNGGRDYSVTFAGKPHESYALGALRLLVVRVSIGDKRFSGDIIVKNLGYRKHVEVIYTTDGWVHTKTTPARYRWSTRDQEYWEFSAPPQDLDDAEREIRFAVKYEVNGSTYWDNNAGRDYAVKDYANFNLPMSLADVLKQLAGAEGVDAWQGMPA